MEYPTTLFEFLGQRKQLSFELLDIPWSDISLIGDSGHVATI